MMKPKFDDVIEYVKAGEDDRQMEKMLDLHPDGQEFLKQARFICRMLQQQSESAGDNALTENLDKAVERMGEVASLKAPSISESPTFYQVEVPRRRARRSPPIRDMIEGEGQRSEDLGTLELAIEGKQVALSYVPSEAATRQARKTRLPKAAKQMDLEGILIHGLGYTIAVPDALTGDELVTIRVNQNISNLPVKRLALIYMPDSGPFVRFRTDDEGIVELPVPDQPGTLRIESRIPQLLHITLET